jgi:hypothetical protein
MKEKVLLKYIPADTKRILDLGTGDGRLIQFNYEQKDLLLTYDRTLRA